MEDAKHQFYAFYDYLMFLWRKKSILLGIPLIFLIGGLLISFLLPKVYVGKVEFYVGEALGDKVNDPKVVTKLLNEKIAKDTQANLQATAPKYKHIQIEYRDDDPEKGEKVFKTVINRFENELSTLYKQKSNLLKQYMESQNKRIKSLETHHSKLNETNSADLQIIMENERELASLQEQVFLTQLDFYDLKQQRPKMISPVSKEKLAMEKKSPNFFANSLMGFLLGCIVTVFVSVFWKHIEDAKAGLNR